MRNNVMINRNARTINARNTHSSFDRRDAVTENVGITESVAAKSVTDARDFRPRNKCEKVSIGRNTPIRKCRIIGATRVKAEGTANQKTGGDSEISVYPSRESEEETH
jgi:hypothetical protein